jgi:hypothetical protein
MIGVAIEQHGDGLNFLVASCLFGMDREVESGPHLSTTPNGAARVMAKASVTDYLKRARYLAALADKKTGDEKKRLLEIADAWFKLADIAAMQAIKSASMPADFPHQSKPH